MFAVAGYRAVCDAFIVLKPNKYVTGFNQDKQLISHKYLFYSENVQNNTIILEFINLQTGKYSRTSMARTPLGP